MEVRVLCPREIVVWGEGVNEKRFGLPGLSVVIPPAVIFSIENERVAVVPLQLKIKKSLRGKSLSMSSVPTKRLLLKENFRKSVSRCIKRSRSDQCLLVTSVFMSSLATSSVATSSLSTSGHPTQGLSRRSVRTSSLRTEVRTCKQQ